MSKTMTKYQLEHFKEKVDRQFEPLIKDQELLVKQFKTEATDKAVSKLSKKIGADTIIDKFAKAEKMLEEARATALTFFQKRKPKDAELNYNFRNDSYRNRDELSLRDCQEQLREWASDLAQREIEKRPEGAKLRQLKELKLKAKDVVMKVERLMHLQSHLTKYLKRLG